MQNKKVNRHFKIVFLNCLELCREEALVCDCKNAYEAVSIAYMTRWDFESELTPIDYLKIVYIYEWDKKREEWKVYESFDIHGREERSGND